MNRKRIRTLRALHQRLDDSLFVLSIERNYEALDGADVRSLDDASRALREAASCLMAAIEEGGP